jgi:DNA ligase-associated metallophosphoesterase
MIIGTKEIICNQQKLILTNQRALFWKIENALVLSDLHVGKAATFRKHGIPISKKVLEDDLDRLQQLIEHFEAEKLIIVGDLFHAEYNSDIHYFRDWIKNLEIQIELIVGNHDRQSTRLYEAMDFEVYAKEKISHGIRFVHDEVSPSDEFFTISGHTHPGVLISGKGRQHIKLPCYQVTSQQLILPAFSKFTGLNTRNMPEGCVNYAFTDAEVFEI